MSEAFRLFVVQ